MFDFDFTLFKGENRGMPPHPMRNSVAYAKPELAAAEISRSPSFGGLVL